jgi:hypothetical protein
VFNASPKGAMYNKQWVSPIAMEDVYRKQWEKSNAYEDLFFNA